MEQNMVTHAKRPKCPTLIVSIAAVTAVLEAGMAALGQTRPQTDLERLQGLWMQRSGGLTKLFLVSGNRFADIFQFPDGITTTQAMIELDETKEPKEINFSFSDATGRGAALKGTVSHSIYKLDGDTFILCAPAKGNGKCTSFDPGRGPERNLVATFARVK
jgi:uncharacterized protein (TIGR03067 family)